MHGSTMTPHSVKLIPYCHSNAELSSGSVYFVKPDGVVAVASTVWVRSVCRNQGDISYCIAEAVPVYICRYCHACALLITALAKHQPNSARQFSASTVLVHMRHRAVLPFAT